MVKKKLKRELTPIDSIKDHYPKYLMTLDYDNNIYNGIKQISNIDFLLGRKNYNIAKQNS